MYKRQVNKLLGCINAITGIAQLQTQVGNRFIAGMFITCLLYTSSSDYSVLKARPSKKHWTEAQKCVIPVSYTHLDVYKRQFLHRGSGVGVQPPAEDKGILFVAAHSDVSVADIDRCV